MTAVLFVTDLDGTLLAATDSDTFVGFEGLEVTADITFVLEVSTEDNGGSGAYTLTIEDQG